MSELFEERPEIVEIVMQNKTGQATRFVAGFDLDTVIARVTQALESNPYKQEKKPRKSRKARRTKAEMAVAAQEESTEQAPVTRRGRPRKSWGGEVTVNGKPEPVTA